MDAGWAGLIGAGIGGGVTLLAQILAVWHQDKSMRHAKLAAEEAWLRDKVHEIYVNCMVYVGSQDYREREKWLNLLLVYYPEPNESGFSQFLDKKNKGGVTLADIVEIASKDRRLQRISYKPRA